ncbi:hypothetical protein Tco_1568332 [Tanacetum coccineum]
MENQQLRESGMFTVGSTNFAGEELLRSVATRMNKMTGKGDAYSNHLTATMPKGAPIVDDNPSVKALLNVSNTDDNMVGKVSPSDPIV